MSKKHLSLYTNIRKSQIQETDTLFIIKDIPILVDGATMNGIKYPREENDLGLKSIIGKVVTLQHPFDDQGRPIDAYSAKGLMDNFSGGVVTATHKENGINYASVEIKKSLLRGQDGGEWYFNRLTDRSEIGVSTGLYIDDSDGIARKQTYNHLAMLPEGEDPAGGSQTFIRFNGCETIAVNVDELIEDSMDDIDSIVEDVKSRGLMGSLIKKVAAMFASGESLGNNDDANKVATTEEQNMLKRDDVIKMLNAKGYTVNEDVTDEALQAMLVKALASNEQEEKKPEANVDGAKKPETNVEGETEIAEKVADLVTKMIQPLADKVDSLVSAQAAQNESEKTAVVNRILSVNRAFTADELNSMPMQTLRKIEGASLPAAGLGHNGLRTNSASGPTASVSLSLDDIGSDK